MTLLADIQQAITDSNCYNVLIAADLNCHFPRNSRFTNIVKSHFDEAGLVIFWENQVENENIRNIDYTHINIANRVPALSTIDDFVGSQRVFESIAEAGVVHSGMNTSNHSAIFTKLRVGDLNLEMESIKGEKRANWAKATDAAKENYKITLSGKLNALAQPNCVNCQDLNCVEHRFSI